MNSTYLWDTTRQTRRLTYWGRCGGKFTVGIDLVVQVLGSCGGIVVYHTLKTSVSAGCGSARCGFVRFGGGVGWYPLRLMLYDLAVSDDLQPFNHRDRESAGSWGPRKRRQPGWDELSFGLTCVRPTVSCLPRRLSEWTTWGGCGRWTMAWSCPSPNRSGTGIAQCPV